MSNAAHSKGEQSIAILCDSLAGWTGGVDFLRFCISALSSASPETSWSVLLPSKRATRSLAVKVKCGLKMLAGRKISPLTGIHKSELKEALTRSGSRIEIMDYRDTASGLADAMRRCGAEALFPCANSLGRSFPLPWIGYIPDLQHKRLPHWFNERERRARDKIFSRLLAEAPAVVVNAAAVVRDIEEFYPDHKARLFALPFCPPAANITQFSNASRSETRQAYNLPACYFVISNQFWIHKSHETAFMALKQVRDAGYDVHLVCTGNTSDYRWPDHFNKLKGIIEQNKLQNFIHILGLVPKCDQLMIMLESVALVQPTLFEGGPGGGAVYDAVSVNIPSIVSDIPVNREIDIGVVRFFAAGCPEDLTAKMIDMITSPPEMPSKETIFAQLSDRQREVGRLLLDIFNLVAERRASLSGM